MEITKVEDLGPTVLVTFRMNKKLCGYFCTILDSLSRAAQQLNHRAKIARAERRALASALSIDNGTADVVKTRNEMIVFLKENGWETKKIAEVYDLTPANIRQILSRAKRPTATL